MTMVHGLAATLAAIVVLAAPAHAVTVENKSDDAIKIGVDYGHNEEVKDVAAQKSVKFDCPDGCGVTGPWGFSWMAQGDDVITSDGNSLIAVGETGSAAEGASGGEAGAAGASD
jgi:hypothetical protein